MFYVYCYFNPLKSSSLHECGFEPFYVGKGKNDRKIHHLFESNLSRDPNKLKRNTILKIRDAGLEPVIITLFQSDDEQECFNEECRLIKCWGRRDLNLGPLSNMTDGGEGASNIQVSSETRKRLSEGTKRAFKEGRLNSNIEALKNSLRGKKQSTEWIQKRATARRGYKHSEETKKKLSEHQRKIRQTLEWKAKASAAQKGKKHSPEHVMKSIQNNPKSQSVELMGISYPSINQAIKASGLTPGQVRKHLTFKKL